MTGRGWGIDGDGCRRYSDRWIRCLQAAPIGDHGCSEAPSSPAPCYRRADTLPPVSQTTKMIFRSSVTANHFCKDLKQRGGSTDSVGAPHLSLRLTENVIALKEV